MEQFYEQFNLYLQTLEYIPPINEAIKYSFVSGGKLIRPRLFFACLKDLEIEDEHWQVALAIEMIHTYSLVHDDLPAMDNDDYRRGRLTTHKQFGDDIAILCGDSLLTHAFDLLATSNLNPQIIVKMIQATTSAAGVNGMIGGQVLDVQNEKNRNLKESELERIHELKTAKMIQLPIVLAHLIAGCDDLSAIKGASKLGLYYQIQDDYLDKYGNEQKMGKKAGSDEGKLTYTDLYSKPQLETYLAQLQDEIKQAFANYPKVLQLVELLIGRER